MSNKFEYDCYLEAQFKQSPNELEIFKSGKFDSSDDRRLRLKTFKRKFK